MSAPVADQRILRGVSSTLSWQNLDGDGNAAAPAGAVTVGVVNAAGTTVVAAGTATSGTGSAPRTYTLPAASNTQLDLLTVTWTDAGDASTHTTLVEVVGAYYFTLAEARASDAALTSDTKYPDAALIEARRQVEEEFELICDLSFVPRYRRERLRGEGRSWLVVSQPRVRAVRSVTTYATPDTGTAWVAGDLTDMVIDDGVTIVSRAGKSFGCGDVVVEYEHGFSRPPAEVKRAALQRLRNIASMPLAGIPDRATSFSVAEGGTYRLDTAGAYKTGMPDVDAVLGRWSLRVPGVA